MKKVMMAQYCNLSAKLETAVSGKFERELEEELMGADQGSVPHTVTNAGHAG